MIPRGTVVGMRNPLLALCYPFLGGEVPTFLHVAAQAMDIAMQPQQFVADKGVFMVVPWVWELLVLSLEMWSSLGTSFLAIWKRGNLGTSFLAIWKRGKLEAFLRKGCSRSSM